MIKVHLYKENGSITVKDQELELTILRSHSVEDGEYVRPTGRQMVMLAIREENGKLIIENKQTGLEIKV